MDYISKEILTKKKTGLLDVRAIALVGKLCKRIDVLKEEILSETVTKEEKEEKEKFASLFISLVKELVYEHNRDTKAIINSISFSKIKFTKKSE